MHLSQLLETGTDWLALYQQVLTLRNDHKMLLKQLQENVQAVFPCDTYPNLTNINHLEWPGNQERQGTWQMNMGCLYGALANHHPILKTLLDYTEALNRCEPTALKEIQVRNHQRELAEPHWYWGWRSEGYYSFWDKEIRIDAISSIPALVQQLTYYVMDTEDFTRLFTDLAKHGDALSDAEIAAESKKADTILAWWGRPLFHQEVATYPALLANTHSISRMEEQIQKLSAYFQRDIMPLLKEGYTCK